MGMMILFVLLIICLEQGKGRQEKERPSMSAMEVTQDNMT